jgi:hypothetical protein
MKYCTLLLAFMASQTVLLAGCHSRKTDEIPPKPVAAAEPAVVPVAAELFVMSRCPYGLMAEDALFPALDKLGDAIDFRLHFIGDVDTDGSLITMHGEPELRANLLQICAAKLAPKAFRTLIACMNRQPEAIPDNYPDCAVKAGIDAAAVTACADGDEGRGLLKASFEYAAQKGIQGSPSMTITGKEFDGPRTTESFLRAFCGSFTGTRPAACASIPEPVEVPVLVLTDARCEPCSRAVDMGLKQLKALFPGLRERVIEYATDEGKALHGTLRAADQKYLPAFVFGDEVLKDASYPQIEKYFEDAGKYHVLLVESGFDPTAEICDNKVDDDSNGKVDCDDPGCKSSLVCRPEQKLGLDVFVMSQCPYGIVALNSMKEVLASFGKHMNFRVHFLVDAGEEGQIESLHGGSEVEEDLRQICAIAKYGKGNRWLDYIWCRNKSPESKDWKACATGAIKASVIEQCSTGPEGRKLLLQDSIMGQELGISASPTWLVNNRFPASALTADEIRAIFCARNPGTPGCDKPLSNDAGGAQPGGGCQAN